MKPFFLLQTNMTNVLRVRAALAERLYGIHKLHANYGRIFSEWSAVERDMGDGLQVRQNECVSISDQCSVLKTEFINQSICVFFLF